MRISSGIIFLIFALGMAAPAADSSMNVSSPVLVELFTSEGCSSCPPADKLLQQLDKSSIASEPLIVLSEHVDYWNHIGWKDPYSSSFFSNRQNAYARHFGLDSVYTPQMVVDGSAEFVGNDSRLAAQAIEKAQGGHKITVRVSSISWEPSNTLRAHIDVDPRSEMSHNKPEVYLVAALDHAESQVLRGENEGRRLTHVAVVLSMTKAGTIEGGANFSQDIRIKLDGNRDLTRLRVIAFVQEAGTGRVLGASMQPVTH